MSLSTELLALALTKDLGRVKPFSETSTTSHVAAYLLQQNITKKYTDTISTESANLAGLNKFLEVNELVGNWSDSIDSAPPMVQKIMSRARELNISQFLDPEGFKKFSLTHAFSVGNVGAGASVLAGGCDVFHKLFRGRLSCTKPILYTLFKGAVYNNFRWEIADLVRKSQFGGFTEVKGSNMFFVPKETTIARIAMTEPTLNMFGQLGYGYCIGDLLKKYHDIDLSVQPKYNQWFARAGSLTGTYCTIDLSSASDTIGIRYLEKQLHKDMYEDLMTLRSPCCRVPGRKKPLKLNMISTMGNGFTFPLETWIFANLVLATYIEMGEPIFDIYGKRRYAVFGDDIICTKEVYDNLCSVLAYSGFTVNQKKSFSTGSFRESCGTDAFKGTVVRAVYLKECTSDADVYSLINRLLVWSSQHNLPLRQTFKYLVGLVPYRPVPLSEEITAGIWTPRKFLKGRKTNHEGNWLYRPLRAYVPKSTIDDLDGDKWFHACVLGTLHGTIEGHEYTPRTIGVTSFVVREDSCPTSWDYRPLIQRDLYNLPELTTRELVASFETNIGYNCLS